MSVSSVRAPDATPPGDSGTDTRIEQQLPLVRNLVDAMTARFPRHVDRQELVQAGVLALVEAAHRFDAERGVPFEAWVAHRIRGAVLDAVRARDIAPRRLRAAARTVAAARSALEADLGRPPTTAETAARAGLSIPELLDVERRLHQSVLLSLDVPVDALADRIATLGSLLVDADAPEPLALIERREQLGYVRDALTCLPPRLRAVLVGYFLDGRTSIELADSLGVTESRISQLRSEALALVRAGIAAQYGQHVHRSDAEGRRALSFARQLAQTSTHRGRVSATPVPLPRSA